jgi:hypothetical protein
MGGGEANKVTGDSFSSFQQHKQKTNRENAIAFPALNYLV